MSSSKSRVRTKSFRYSSNNNASNYGSNNELANISKAFQTLGVGITPIKRSKSHSNQSNQSSNYVNVNSSYSKSRSNQTYRNWEENTQMSSITFTPTPVKPSARKPTSTPRPSKKRSHNNNNNNTNNRSSSNKEQSRKRRK